MSLPQLDKTATDNLQHPTNASRPIVVAAFYPDGQVVTFTPDGFNACEITLPTQGLGNLYLEQTTAALQLTTVLSTDSVAAPTKQMATSWYTSQGVYKCTTYSD